MKRKPSLAAAAAPSPRASNGSSRGAFVEFHSSMSLENPATAFDLDLSHQPPKNSQERLTKSPEGDHHHATLESVLSQRFELWTQVNETIETLQPLGAYACEVAALKKLQELHLLCNILPQRR